MRKMLWISEALLKQYRKYKVDGPSVNFLATLKEQMQFAEVEPAVTQLAECNLPICVRRTALELRVAQEFYDKAVLEILVLEKLLELYSGEVTAAGKQIQFIRQGFIPLLRTGKLEQKKGLLQFIISKCGGTGIKCSGDRSHGQTRWRGTS